MIGAGAAGAVPVPAGAEPVEPGGDDVFGSRRAGALIGRGCRGVGGRLRAHLLDERILDLEERERRKLARLDLDGCGPRQRNARDDGGALDGGGRDCGRDGCARRARGGSRRRSGGRPAVLHQLRPLERGDREEQHSSDDQNDLLLLRLGGGGVLCASLGHQGVAPAATVPSEDVSVDVDGSGAGVAGTGALKA